MKRVRSRVSRATSLLLCVIIRQAQYGCLSGVERNQVVFESVSH